jgi:tetratricopeptide (TPR) repeat protein
MLHAPGIPVFIDGRANTLYDEEVYDDYTRAYRGGSDVHGLLRKYDVDAVLVPPRSGIARALLRGGERWSVAYRDPIAVVLFPPSRAASHARLPDAEEVLEGSPELWLLRGQAALRRGQLRAAEDALEQTIAMRPLLGSGHSLLLSVAAQRRDRDALERRAQRAIDLYPREAPRFYQHLASNYEQLGDPWAALEALRKAVPRGPFMNPTRTLAQIRRLEGRVREAKGAGRGSE